MDNPFNAIDASTVIEYKFKPEDPEDEKDGSYIQAAEGASQEAIDQANRRKKELIEAAEQAIQQKLDELKALFDGVKAELEAMPDQVSSLASGIGVASGQLALADPMAPASSAAIIASATQKIMEVKSQVGQAKAAVKSVTGKISQITSISYALGIGLLVKPAIDFLKGLADGVDQSLNAIPL